MKKIFLVALLSIVAIGTWAQSYTMNAAIDGSGITTATVTNTGAGVLMTKASAGNKERSNTTVQIVATKTSGTVAGTITLMGSTDGVNWKAATITDSNTALHTFTATDVASQTFIWRLAGQPYPYYEISWTGSGTMVATFTGIVYLQ